LQELKGGNNFLLALASTISRYFSAGDFLLLMLLARIFPCICSVLWKAECGTSCVKLLVLCQEFFDSDSCLMDRSVTYLWTNLCCFDSAVNPISSHRVCCLWWHEDLASGSFSGKENLEKIQKSFIFDLQNINSMQHLL
jgi:hypothetical protein